MVEQERPGWLILDGYEDEPAAFGVPPYVGFHIRYVCGVLEQHKIDYTYMTIDQWRLTSQQEREDLLRNTEGFVCIAGAVVPGRYIRGTPISRKESTELIRLLPRDIPALFGGWAVRGWKQQGWLPLRSNLFLAVQDTDATLNQFLKNGTWKHERRNAEEWTTWAQLGATSKAVTHIILTLERMRTKDRSLTKSKSTKAVYDSNAVVNFALNPRKGYQYGEHLMTSSKKSNLLMIQVFNMFDLVE